MKTLKTVGSILAGFIVVVILSIGIDAILEATGIFPPQSNPGAYTATMLFFALIYRCLATIAGGYTSARLAPDRPMRHAVILGIIGIVAGTFGAVLTWNYTPHHWYPIALVVTAVPCTWLGGRLRGASVVQPVKGTQ